MTGEQGRAGQVWSRIGRGGIGFREIWAFEPDDKFLRRLRMAETLKTSALINQVIGSGLDAHAYFGGQAEEEWTRDAKEYVTVTGSLLNFAGAALDWLGGPEARMAQAKQQIAAIQQQAMEFKPEPFDWDPNVTEEQYDVDPDKQHGWVKVSADQIADAERRNSELETPLDTRQEAVDQFYGTSAVAMNQTIRSIIIQANGADIRSSLTLGKAALETLMTVKGQWDSEKAGDEDETTKPPQGPPAPVYLPPRADPPLGGGSPDPATQLAGLTTHAGPVSTLGGGTAAARLPPSVGPTGGFPADSRPGPIGGFMGAPPVAGRGAGGRRGEEDSYARQWEVTEEDGEIWGTGTIAAVDGGVLA